MVHWRREWQTIPVFLPQELHDHEQDEKTKNMPLEDEPPRSEGVQYATGEEYWNSLPFPPPVDHILSELFTMIRPWVTLHSMAHSFTE